MAAELLLQENKSEEFFQGAGDRTDDSSFLWYPQTMHPAFVSRWSQENAVEQFYDIFLFLLIHIHSSSAVRF